ncbi:MAG TPA: D-amino-acid transaminase [Gemmatimonadaceae bacterium]|nr:D-amino-acid transaminase [Gemmatimonadaceae bacterium]
MGIVYLNGEFIPKERAMISVDDRGFIFGDGIYEVVRVIDARTFEWGAHAERLTRGLAGLRINFGARDVSRLSGVCERLVRDNALTEGEATVYLQITRGAAPRTHHFPPADTAPTVYANATKFIVPLAQRENGVAAITFPDFRWGRCDLKTVNLLGAVLARQAAAEVGAYEAILLKDGVMTEGAATNAFAVIEGTIRTYPLSNYILPGITRKVIVELIAELGLSLAIDPVTQRELGGVDELFLTGTTTDVTPVVTLDGRPVGNGKPGPLARMLQEALTARMYATAGAARR